VTVLPLTVQADDAVENVTVAFGSLLVALTVNEDPGVGAGNVIVCVANVTVKDCDTGAAALNVALPAWLA